MRVLDRHEFAIKKLKAESEFVEAKVCRLNKDNKISRRKGINRS